MNTDCGKPKSTCREETVTVLASRVTTKKLNALCNRDDCTKDDRKFKKFH
ncbi:hypothetical protein DIE20_11615 [Burkholderia sp. Bp9131]|nr:hypothetical protein DIE20_11615 [Burkholderia sp. Bp9131]